MNNLCTLDKIIKENGREGNDSGFYFIQKNGEEKFLSYAELYDKALYILNNLQGRGMKPGHELLFQIKDDDNEIFLELFCACILGKIIPVPITVVSNENTLKVFNVWSILDNPKIISDIDTLEGLNEFAIKNDLQEQYSNIKENSMLIQDVLKEIKFGKEEEISEDDIAFIQFSSGSTGNPKGVVLTHKNIITNLIGILESGEIKKDDITLSWMPLTHDMGLIGCTLAAMVYRLPVYNMPATYFVRKPSLWISKIHEHRITVTSSPNFGYRHFLDCFREKEDLNWDLSCVRRIFNGAEPISIDVLDEFYERLSKYKLSPLSMFTVYGMAEACLGVAFPKCNDGYSYVNVERNSIKIGQKIVYSDESGDNLKNVKFAIEGKPIKGSYIKIVDENNNEVPEDVVGLIKINGDNVTSEYYKNPEVTSEIIDKDGWLNTGDLGFISNGNLVVTGRKKEIIFVNGHNYYPHDLEKLCEKIDGMKKGQVVVCGIYDEDNQKEKLILFVKYRKKPEEFYNIQLKLKAKLQEYIGVKVEDVIPIRIIPKTTSGKIQRFILKENYKNGEYDLIKEELDAIDKANIESKKFKQPTNETEKILLDIWSNVLKDKQIGIETSLFELGANSISVMNIIGLITDKLNKTVEISTLFENPTIELLAKALENIDYCNNTTLKKAEELNYYNLSKEQLRIYVASEFSENKTVYNSPVIARLYNEIIDPIKAEKVINSLINKYEVLRTSIEIVDSIPMQKINDNVKLYVKHDNIKECELKSIVKNFIKPFDLNRAPLMRFNIYKVDNDTIFLIDIHHIIIDGTSISLFVKEFLNIYYGKSIEEAKFQYKDYVAYQDTDEYKMNIEKMEQYWLDKFKQEVPELYLPEDFERKQVKKYNGKRISFKLNDNLKDEILKLSNKYQVTEFNVFLSIFNIFMHLYTGESDIVIGTPVAGRSLKDLKDMLGIFINMVPIRTKFDEDIKISELLQVTSKNTLESLDMGEYPFDMLIKKIGTKKNCSLTSLFNVAFVYENFDYPEVNSIKYSINDANTETSQYDLLLLIHTINDGYKFEFEYDTDLYEEETIIRFIYSFNEIIEQVIENTDINLNEMSLYEKPTERVIINT